MEGRLHQKTYATFERKEDSKNLSSLCLDLVSEQKETWQDLREGYACLEEIRERTLSCEGFLVRLQYNPRRIASSLAMAAGKTDSKQECFLCLDHLPDGQKGILYRGQYLILCNPMPVLTSQFTVAHLAHCDQSIFEHMGPFFQLLDDLGSGWTVLYNGPNCGASAPDHHHFHVAPSGQMPIEKEIRKKKWILMKEAAGAFLYRMKDAGRETIILEGNDRTAVQGALRDYLGALKSVLLLEEEPMINIAAFCEKRKWRLLIFPRRKHRPDVFFKEGEERIVVSPGVIEMGGILVTPLERDFERLDRATVESIYEEVSLDRETAEEAVHVM